jgi:hypothetical protein
VQRLGLGVAAETAAERGKIVEAFGDAGIVGTQMLLPLLQRCSVERFCFSQAAEAIQNNGL